MSGGETAELPEGWAWSMLGDLGAWFGGGTPTTSVSEYWDGGTIPWISAKDMKAERLGSAQDSITEAGRAASRLSLLPPGSVLMVVRGMILARAFPVALTTAPATINQDLRAIVPSPAVEPMFLLRALQFIGGEVVQATGEATHGTRRLESDRLKSWPIPIPPLAEQRRIVAAIERVFERVTSARERLEWVPTTLKRFRQAVLTAACSGRLTADWRANNQEIEFASVLLKKMVLEREEKWLARNQSRRYRPADEMEGDDLSEIPNSWVWTNFDHCAWEVTVGHVGPMRNQYVSVGVPFLRSQNVRPLRFDPTGLVFVEDDFHKQLRKSALIGGEILVTRSGANTGDCCVYPADGKPANCADLVVTRPLSGLLPEYGALYISSPDGQERIGLRETGMAQPHFNIGAMRVKPFPLPPLAEQREIVRRVSAILVLADSIEERSTSALRRVESLTQAVLAKAFRGELVPTEAELARRERRFFEPASELLARLRGAAAASKRGSSRKSRSQSTIVDEASR